MKKGILLWVVFLLFSCAEKQVEKPGNLIAKETMVHILYDLALLNAAESSFSTELQAYKVETMEFLYQKYQIDSVQLVQSDLYYASHPLDYQFIYKTIEKKLKKRKEELQPITFWYEVIFISPSE